MFFTAEELDYLEALVTADGAAVLARASGIEDARKRGVLEWLMRQPMPKGAAGRPSELLKAKWRVRLLRRFAEEAVVAEADGGTVTVTFDGKAARIPAQDTLDVPVFASSVRLPAAEGPGFVPAPEGRRCGERWVDGATGESLRCAYFASHDGKCNYMTEDAVEQARESAAEREAEDELMARSKRPDDDAAEDEPARAQARADAQF